MFDVPLKPVTVDEGDKLSLRCHVCGSAPLKIQWMKDRKDLTSAGSTRISFSDGTACLEISSASRHDAGDYLCKATNEAGSEFCKARVTVKGETRASERPTPSPHHTPLNSDRRCTLSHFKLTAFSCNISNTGLHRTHSHVWN